MCKLEHLLMSLMLFVLYSRAVGQITHAITEEKIGLGKLYRVNDIVHMVDGGIAVVGDNLSSRGGGDDSKAFFGLVREGRVVWTMDRESNGSDLGQSVAIDDDGGMMYVLGVTSDQTEKEAVSGSDIFVLKVNLETQAEIDSLLINSNGVEGARKILVSDMGKSFVIVGASTEYMPDYSGKRMGMFAAKYDAESMSLSWGYQYGNHYLDRAENAAVDRNSDLIVLGIVHHFAGVRRVANPYLFKLDSRSGAVIWKLPWARSDSDHVTKGLVVDSSNMIHLITEKRISEYDGVKSRQVKVSENGNLIFSKVICCEIRENQSSSHSLLLDSEDRLYVPASTADVLGETLWTGKVFVQDRFGSSLDVYTVTEPLSWESSFSMAILDESNLGITLLRMTDNVSLASIKYEPISVQPIEEGVIVSMLIDVAWSAEEKEPEQMTTHLLEMVQDRQKLLDPQNIQSVQRLDSPGVLRMRMFISHAGQLRHEEPLQSLKTMLDDKFVLDTLSAELILYDMTVVDEVPRSFEDSDIEGMLATPGPEPIQESEPEDDNDTVEDGESTQNAEPEAKKNYNIQIAMYIILGFVVISVAVSVTLIITTWHRRRLAKKQLMDRTKYYTVTAPGSIYVLAKDLSDKSFQLP